MSLLEPFFKDYKIHDVDEAGDPKYYGFADKEGKWLIIRNVSDSTFRYLTNEKLAPQYSDYAEAWADRASLVGWDYLYNVI